MNCILYFPPQFQVVVFHILLSIVLLNQFKSYIQMQIDNGTKKGQCIWRLSNFGLTILRLGLQDPDHLTFFFETQFPPQMIFLPTYFIVLKCLGVYLGKSKNISVLFWPQAYLILGKNISYGITHNGGRVLPVFHFPPKLFKDAQKT